MPTTQYRNVVVTPAGAVTGEHAYSLGGDEVRWVPFTARLDLLLIAESDIDTGCEDWSEVRDSHPADHIDLIADAQQALPLQLLADRLGVDEPVLTQALRFLRT